MRNITSSQWEEYEHLRAQAEQHEGIVSRLEREHEVLKLDLSNSQNQYQVVVDQLKTLRTDFGELSENHMDTRRKNVDLGAKLLEYQEEVKNAQKERGGMLTQIHTLQTRADQLSQQLSDAESRYTNTLRRERDIRSQFENLSMEHRRISHEKDTQDVDLELANEKVQSLETQLALLHSEMKKNREEFLESRVSLESRLEEKVHENQGLLSENRTLEIGLQQKINELETVQRDGGAERMALTQKIEILTHDLGVFKDQIQMYTDQVEFHKNKGRAVFMENHEIKAELDGERRMVAILKKEVQEKIEAYRRLEDHVVRIRSDPSQWILDGDTHLTLGGESIPQTIGRDGEASGRESSTTLSDAFDYRHDTDPTYRPPVFDLREGVSAGKFELEDSDDSDARELLSTPIATAFGGERTPSTVGAASVHADFRKKYMRAVEQYRIVRGEKLSLRDRIDELERQLRIYEPTEAALEAMESERDTLMNQVEALTQECFQLTEKLENVPNIIDERISQIQAEREDFRTRYFKAKRQITDLERTYAKTVYERSKWNNKLTNTVEKVVDVEQLIRELATERSRTEDLIQTNKRLEEEFNTMVTSFEQRLNQTVDAPQDIVVQTVDNAHQLMTQIQEQMKDRDADEAPTVTPSKTEAEIVEQFQEYAFKLQSDHNTKMQEKDNHLERLQNEIRKLQESLMSRLSNQTELESAKLNLTTMNERLENDLSENKNRANALSDQMNALRMQLDQEREKMIAAQMENQRLVILETEKASLEERVVSLENQLKISRKQHNKILKSLPASQEQTPEPSSLVTVEQLLATQEEKITLQHEAAQLRKQVDQLTQDLRKSSGLLRQAEREVKSKVAEAEASRQKFTGTQRDLEHELEKMNIRFEERDTLVESLQTAIEQMSQTQMQMAAVAATSSDKESKEDEIVTEGGPYDPNAPLSATQLKQRIQDLYGRVGHLTDESESYKDQFEHWKNEAVRLQRELDSRGGPNDELSANLETAQELNGLRAHNEELQGKLKSLRLDLEKRTRFEQKQSHTSNSQQEEIEQLTWKNNEANKRIEDLSQQVQKFQKDFEDEIQSHAETLKNLNDAKKELPDVRERLSITQQQLEIEKNRGVNLTTQVSSFQMEREQIEEQFEQQIRELREEQKAHDEQIRLLTADNDQLRDELTLRGLAGRATSASPVPSQRAGSASASGSGTANLSMSRSLQRFKDRLGEKQKDLIETQTENSKLKMELEQMTEELENLRKELNAVQSGADSMSLSAQRELLSEFHDLRPLYESNVSLRQEVQNYKDRLDKVQADMSELKQKNEHIAEEKRDLHQQVSQGQSRVNALESQIEVYRKSHSQFLAKYQEIDPQEHENLVQERNTLKHKESALKERVNEANKQLKRMKTNFQVAVAKQKEQNKTEFNTKLKALTRESKVKESHIQKLNGKLNERQDELNKMKTLLDKTRADVTKLRQQPGKPGAADTQRIAEDLSKYQSMLQTMRVNIRQSIAASLKWKKQYADVVLEKNALEAAIVEEKSKVAKLSASAPKPSLNSQLEAQSAGDKVQASGIATIRRNRSSSEPMSLKRLTGVKRRRESDEEDLTDEKRAVKRQRLSNASSTTDNDSALETVPEDDVEMEDRPQDSRRSSIADTSEFPDERDENTPPINENDDLDDIVIAEDEDGGFDEPKKGDEDTDIVEADSPPVEEKEIKNADVQPAVVEMKKPPPPAVSPFAAYGFPSSGSQNSSESFLKPSSTGWLMPAKSTTQLLAPPQFGSSSVFGSSSTFASSSTFGTGFSSFVTTTPTQPTEAPAPEKEKSPEPEMKGDVPEDDSDSDIEILSGPPPVSTPTDDAVGDEVQDDDEDASFGSDDEDEEGTGNPSDDSGSDHDEVDGGFDDSEEDNGDFELSEEEGEGPDSGNVTSASNSPSKVVIDLMDDDEDD